MRDVGMPDTRERRRARGTRIENECETVTEILRTREKERDMAGRKRETA